MICLHRNKDSVWFVWIQLQLYSNGTALMEQWRSLELVLDKKDQGGSPVFEQRHAATTMLHFPVLFLHHIPFWSKSSTLSSHMVFTLDVLWYLLCKIWAPTPQRTYRKNTENWCFCSPLSRPPDQFSSSVQGGRLVLVNVPFALYFLHLMMTFVLSPDLPFYNEIPLMFWKLSVEKCQEKPSFSSTLQTPGSLIRVWRLCIMIAAKDCKGEELEQIVEGSDALWKHTLGRDCCTLVGSVWRHSWRRNEALQCVFMLLSLW